MILSNMIIRVMAFTSVAGYSQRPLSGHEKSKQEWGQKIFFQVRHLCTGSTCGYFCGYDLIKQTKKSQRHLGRATPTMLTACFTIRYPTVRTVENRRNDALHMQHDGCAHQRVHDRVGTNLTFMLSKKAKMPTKEVVQYTIAILQIGGHPCPARRYATFPPPGNK